MSESMLETMRRKIVQWRTNRAKDLDPSVTHDLHALYQRGFVKPKAAGQTIETIQGRIESRINKPLKLVIPVGTYFVAQGNYQNMVTREPYELELGPTGSVSFSVSATCINAELPIPGEQDKFVGVDKVSEPIVRFLQEAAGCGPMVIQAGVWALTDNYSAYEVREHLVSRDSDGNSIPAISEVDVDVARDILTRLNIHTRL